MQNENLITIRKFCVSHNLEHSFIDELGRHGLIEITSIEEENYLDREQLPELEKFTRLYADLGINIEGIGAVQHLLQKVEAMQTEIRTLKYRLNIYEID